MGFVDINGKNGTKISPDPSKRGWKQDRAGLEQPILSPLFGGIRVGTRGAQVVVMRTTSNPGLLWAKSTPGPLVSIVP